MIPNKTVAEVHSQLFQGLPFEVEFFESYKNALLVPIKARAQMNSDKRRRGTWS